MTEITYGRLQIALFLSTLFCIAGCICSCKAINQPGSSIDYNNPSVEDIPVLMEEMLSQSTMEIQIRAKDAIILVCQRYGASPFLDVLGNDDPEVQSNAVIILGYLVRRGLITYEREPALIPSLIEELNDENSEVVTHTCSALGDVIQTGVRDYETSGGVPGEQTNILGDSTQDLISALLPLLENEDDNVRVMAANVLNYIGHDSIEAVPKLIEMLNDDDYLVRVAAAIALAIISPENEEAIPVLIEGVEKGNLERIPGEEHRWQPSIGGSNNSFIEAKCAFALKLIGEPAAVAIPYLVKLFESDEFYVRADIPEVIASIDPSGETAVPILIELLGDENPQVQRHAALTLRYIGPPAVDALPVLKEMQARSGELTPEVRAEVNAAIESIESVAE
jgi:HEAT repeat protein